MSGESSLEYQVITFFNPDNAYAYGIELDLRKKLSFLGEGKVPGEYHIQCQYFYQLNHLLIFQQHHLIHMTPNRPMQGQSPYLVNLSLTYADDKANWSSTVLFNRIGQRIETVGAFGIPEVYENGRSVLDFQLAKKVLKKKGEIKINVANLLNTLDRYSTIMWSLKKRTVPIIARTTGYSGATCIWYKLGNWFLILRSKF